MRPRIFAAGCAALALLVLPTLAYYAARGVRYLTPDYNEGWNAFFAGRAMSGDGLYPGSGEFIFNNYPPLSFYIVGAVGRLLGDNIFAGRLVSAVAFIVVAVLLAVIVARLSRSAAAGAFAGLLFAVLFAQFPGGRLGLDDPQLLGHAVMTGGLAIAWLAPARFDRLLPAAILMAIALLIKHNLVAAPLAATVWMALQGRRPLLAWAGALAIAGALGAALLWSVWGTAPVLAMLTPRRVLLVRYLIEGRDWLRLLDVPIAVWIMLWAMRAWRPRFHAAGWYAAVSFAVFLLFVGGDGIGPNVAFDVLIAVALCVGLALSATGAEPIAAAAVALLVVHAALTAPLPLVKDSLRDGARALNAGEQATLRDIDYLKRRPEPALCEDIALCYWAGKPFFYDAFNMRQLFILGRRDEDDILRLLRERRIGVVELSRPLPAREDDRFSVRFSQTLSTYYHLDREGGGRWFFVPR